MTWLVETRFEDTVRMRSYTFPLVCAIHLTHLAGCSSSTPGSSVLAEDALAASDGVAVVELFTSQGCSSCPPADQVLTQIATWSDRHDAPVYCLSFHVDYWNQLGWSDPYSTQTCSQRQRAYAAAMKKRRVYTPQMIVNGTAEFVGSRSDRAGTALRDALTVPATNTVKLTARMADNDAEREAVEVRYQIAGDTDNRLLNVAVVESTRKNNVPRGENANRALQHTNVVRAFRVLPLEQATATTRMSIPKGLLLDDLKLIAYVQSRGSLQITGAAEADVAR